jgi:hypothetical protein
MPGVPLAVISGLSPTSLPSSSTPKIVLKVDGNVKLGGSELVRKITMVEYLPFEHAVLL